VSVVKLRGGVFGCGMISEFHLRGWQRIPEVEIVALGNRTISRAEARRRELCPGVCVYDNLAAMLREERLDFADILSVPWLHREHCLQAKDAGVHIYFERECVDCMLTGKPVTQSAARNFGTLAATFAAYRSAETGRIVDVGPFLAIDPGR
jgi:hypothetical protein